MLSARRLCCSLAPVQAEGTAAGLCKVHPHGGLQSTIKATAEGCAGGGRMQTTPRWPLAGCCDMGGCDMGGCAATHICVQPVKAGAEVV